MVKAKIENETVNAAIKLRVRFDYRGAAKPKGLFFGGKSVEQVAEEVRENKVALLRNVPFQGIHIEHIDTSSQPYLVVEEPGGAQAAYAPVLVTIRAEVIEDIIRFIMREEFRKVEVLEPEVIELSKQDIERFLFRVSEEMRHYRSSYERRSD